jgi:hypothetical protein
MVTGSRRGRRRRLVVVVVVVVVAAALVVVVERGARAIRRAGIIRGTYRAGAHTMSARARRW